MKNFETMLAIEGTCAQKTLSDAMVEWWMAADADDAFRQITSNPGSDLAGIKNSVISGLTALAHELGVVAEELVSEDNLKVLAQATPAQIVRALDAIHNQWIQDNFTARRWGEKFFKGQLPQYRKTAKLAWEEVVKDLLFIANYLQTGGNTHSVEEIQEAFLEYAKENDDNDDVGEIASRARSFADDIIDAIKGYRAKLDPEKKAAQIAEIDAFLAVHSDGAKIMEIMIETVTE